MSQLKGSFKPFWNDKDLLGRLKCKYYKRMKNEILFSVMIGNDGNWVLNLEKPNLDYKFHCNGSNIIFPANSGKSRRIFKRRNKIYS